MNRQRGIIIGAGPAGLTAAYELLTRAGIKAIVLEKSDCMGGISRTVNYKGNRIDIGGHRFFSKSNRVMEWWLQMLPLQASEHGPVAIKYHRMEREIAPSASGTDPATADSVMLLRARKSRIYYLRRFFDYPISLSKDTLLKLGLWRTFKIGVSYVQSVLFPLKQEETLEQFFINRFGQELYRTFFKSYTEKVWGVPCDRISAEWGAQRIKGLSIRKAIAHFVRQAVKSGDSDLAQKRTETSLIEQFLYPKFGPGQMWEEVARKIVAGGGEIITGIEANGVETQGMGTQAGRVVSVTGVDAENNARRFTGDYFFSTTSVQELVRAMGDAIPSNMREISEGLQYRDFITVGLLLKKLETSEPGDRLHQLISDTWIYIQEPDVLVGRLQLFNNWSPYLVADPKNVWLGAEYFCYEGDDLWRKSDDEMAQLAAEELDKIGILDKADVLDSTVARMPKTYPAYFGTYSRFSEVRDFLDKFENLFLIGRNGMHKYNNMDHSMLTAMTAIDNILASITDKSNIWAVNTEQDYLEAKSSAQTLSAKSRSE